MSLADKKQELSQEASQKKPESLSSQKEAKEEPLSFNQRGPVKTQDVKWKILSSKGELYNKYGMTGKEAEEFAKEMGEHGGFLEPAEASRLKRKWDIARRSTPNIGEKTKIENKLKFLKDKYGI